MKARIGFVSNSSSSSFVVVVKEVNYNDIANRVSNRCKQMLKTMAKWTTIFNIPCFYIGDISVMDYSYLMETYWSEWNEFRKELDNEPEDCWWRWQTSS